MAQQRTTFQLHDLVYFSAQQDSIFKITELRADGTVDIECCLANDQVLSYDMVAKEMLKKIVQAD